MLPLTNLQRMPWNVLDCLSIKLSNLFLTRVAQEALPERTSQGGGLRKWKEEGVCCAGRAEGWLSQVPYHTQDHSLHTHPRALPTDPAPRQGPEDPAT